MISGSILLRRGTVLIYVFDIESHERKKVQACLCAVYPQCLTV
jgi:hypothetical protein